jgi:PAS domain S-box-containing protein
MLDITEQKNAQEQIVKEKELSDSVINSLPGIFYLFDETGKFIRWNNNFETISEYSGAEISKMHPLDLFDKAEKKILAARIKSVIEQGSADVEANFFTKSGKKIPFYFNGWKLQYEGKPCLIGVGIDITERKKVETDLINSEEKYRELFHHNPMSMWMYDILTLQIIDVNEAAILHYGYSRDEFLSMTILQLRPKEDIPKILDAVKDYNRGMKASGIWRHLKKDGTEILTAITSHTVEYESRKCRLILADDVTDKIAAEEKLNASNKQLRELSAYLSTVREEERKHIAREIHDELGQQVTGVKIDISLLKKKIMTTNPELEHEFLQVGDLLDQTVKTIRRISSELRPSMLDDIGLIPALEWQCNEFKRRTGVNCEFNKKRTENIVFDPSTTTGVFRILQESLTNIARHANANDVFVSIQKNETNLELKIVDNGVGFDTSVTKKTFGLLGMKERAIMMKGKLQIESTPNKGTSTILTIPLAT